MSNPINLWLSGTMRAGKNTAAFCAYGRLEKDAAPWPDKLGSENHIQAG